MDLAPVLDLDAGNGPNNSDADGTRSFSLDESIAASDGLAFAAGLRTGGVIPVVKHFPGLGNASGNTDATPATTLPWSELQQHGLLPFSAAVAQGYPAVMVSNASVPGLTTLPASISSTLITGVLRTQAQIGYSVPAATVAALAAGADMMLFSSDAAHVASTTAVIVQAIRAAVNNGSLQLSRLEDAVAHILATKGIDPCIVAPPA